MESKAGVTDKASGKHAYWIQEIQMYEKETTEWHERGKRIVRRYKDKRSVRETSDGSRKYNILYSNVQTLLPAYFSRSPKPDIERRFKDKDDVGRVAAEVWERTVSYFIETDKFRHAVKQAVIDRLLPGRGVIWMRYLPHMRDIEVTGNQDVMDDGVQESEDVEPVQEVYYEEVCTDYVYWEDFGHNVARVWEEVYAVWRKVYLFREELVERFGEEIGQKITLDYSPKGLNDEKINDSMKKATVYEIWDKKDGKAIWLHKDYPDLLDERDDPLQLDDFFPCPRPLLPTLTNDSLIPIPDYSQYQDQAKELDDLTGRIAAITKGIKVAGVYDASAAGVERLLSEGTENRLIAVEQWALFGDKGGLKGVMDLLPMHDILETLLGLYEAREKVKQDLYEITGLSDIIRGATKATETATAQNIKTKYAALRLDDGQHAIERFARDLVKIAAQIIANHFSLDTIKAISGVKLLTQQEKAQVQMQYAPHPPIPGQPPMPAPKMPEELEEQMMNPTWEEVYALLKDNAMRCFRIDIETNSTIKPDEEAEKQNRVEFLTAVGSYIQQASQVAEAQPALTPLLMQMLQFGVRGFPVGKQLETTFELVSQKIAKAQEAAENAPPQPNPEQQKVQAQMELNKAQLQNDQQKAQADLNARMQEKQMDMQLEREKMAQQAAMEDKRMQMDAQREAAKMQQEMELERQKMAAQFALDEKIAMMRLDIESRKNTVQ